MNFSLFRSVAAAATGALLLLSSAIALATESPTTLSESIKPRAIPLKNKEFKGDFDGMLELRSVRILIPYSRTLYFNDKGQERGITADAARDFERYINKKYQKELGKRPITVYIIPTTRDKLQKNLVGGFGDIAAGDLEVTPTRRQFIDFYVPPDQFLKTQVVLTGPKSPTINSLSDLAGKTVHVRKSSSYHESLVELNNQFKKEGKPAINIAFVSDALENEDMMEMLNAGVLQAVVVHRWLAKMWAPVLPKIKINEGVILKSDIETGWAVRKNSPKLHEIIGDFYINGVKKVNPIAARMAKYNKRIKQMNDPSTSEDSKRFKDTLALFDKYGKQYGFDPLMLAAQGYQESQLNQKAKSHVGAIGIMQVMPATGAELKVGDISIAENNVHAGTKYMDRLMGRYFKDAKFNEMDRCLFAFASYNAGPGSITRMRKEAMKRGLDPDVWFNNVEIITAEKIGIETTTYVRNIFKYYVSYKLILASQEAKAKAREALTVSYKGSE